MTRIIIPVPVIAVAAQVLENHFTHTQLDTLMESLGIPGPPPVGNKVDKIRGWLKKANQDPNSRSDPLEKLGKVLEEFMEVDPPFFGPESPQIEGRRKMEIKLREHGLEYAKGGRIVFTASKPLIQYQPDPPRSSHPTAEQLISWKRAEEELESESELQLSLQKERHTIFLGHGHSPVWRELKDFLQERLNLKYEEFNSESAAGTSTKERLDAMLDKVNFAFLVMTAEDERTDGTFHARENVIHEAGLFQGRLGFKRAIILKEEGCQEFSNIHGLTHIPFPRGRISAAFEEIRRVLEREGMIK